MDLIIFTVIIFLKNYPKMLYYTDSSAPEGENAPVYGKKQYLKGRRQRMEETSKKITTDYFNKTAEDYDTSHDGKFVQCMYREILARVPDTRGQRLLDLGCGNGNILKILNERIPAEYYGLDISEKMIEEAGKKLGKAARLQVGDAEQLPYKDNFFDVVVCNASFHHYPNPEKAAAEMGRIIKSGGLLILGDPTMPSIMIEVFNWALKWSSSGDVKLWKKREIRELFGRCGFAMEDWKRINYRCFVCSLRKK